jgi:hypothetical protein
MNYERLVSKLRSIAYVHEGKKEEQRMRILKEAKKRYLNTEEFKKAAARLKRRKDEKLLFRTD